MSDPRAPPYAIPQAEALKRCVVIVVLITAIGIGGGRHRADVTVPSHAVLIEEPTTMDIIVRLRADLARAFHSGLQDSAAIKQLKAVLTEFGVALKPLHPGVSDAELQSYFTISGVTSADADGIVRALRDLEGVEAAYVQPPVTPAS